MITILVYITHFWCEMALKPTIVTQVLNGSCKINLARLPRVAFYLRARTIVNLARSCYRLFSRHSRVVLPERCNFNTHEKLSKTVEREMKTALEARSERQKKYIELKQLKDKLFMTAKRPPLREKRYTICVQEKTNKQSNCLGSWYIMVVVLINGHFAI